MGVCFVRIDMTEDSCPCCGSVTEQRPVNDPEVDHWQVGDSVLTTELPQDLSVALGRFLGTESVETLDGWVTAVRYHIDGAAITIDELCVTDEETGHWGIADGTKYHFVCFYDAVILAALVETSVDIRTKSPNGMVIEAHAVGTDDLTVAPDEAVFSFGIDKDVSEPSDDGPSLEAGYAAICPYVKAFPNQRAYERWANSVHAATVGMPLAGATELAAALIK